MSLPDDVTFRRLSRVGLERAAREACLSPYRFQLAFARVFWRESAGMRMETAKRLLIADDLSLTEFV